MISSNLIVHEWFLNISIRAINWTLAGTTIMSHYITTRIELELISMKRYSQLPTAPEVDSHHQINLVP